jgi:hypothetical protein
VAEFVYPLLCIGGKAFASALRQEGIPLDVSLLPSAAAIFPHLQPSTGVVRRTSAGIEIEKRGPLAGISSGTLLPVAAFLLVGRHVAMPMSTNALLAVEAHEAHVVSWTKPDDLDFDPQKPATGLTGQPAGGFIAAFCDGSVRSIYDSIDLETLRNLVDRHDGKPIVNVP